jgi:hypothetical protein
MCRHLTLLSIPVLALTLLTAQDAVVHNPAVCAADEGNPNAAAAAVPAKTRFLILGKCKVADPPQQQKRGIFAVRRVAKAARSAEREAQVDALVDDVMTIPQYRRGQATETVTGKVFRERLRQLKETATPQDTVIIYTHSHGRQNGFETSQPHGGLVMDLPVRQTEHAGALLWDEYAERLLEIPAKNVVVLTMACFAGGLVDYLDSPEVRERWKDRRAKEGRNLIVLTSQNASLTSDPIVRNGELINPFTDAVVRTLEGEADGFALADGKPIRGTPADGHLSVGEFIDSVLFTTEHTVSESAQRRNTARPQVTGSFDRDDVLFPRIQPTVPASRRENPPRDNTSTDAVTPGP